MKVRIKASDMDHMDLFPEDEETEIIQNILCILATVEGTCPGLRDFGIDPKVLHKPIPVAKSAYAVSISQQMAKYEPRATLVGIDFEEDPVHPEILLPILEVTIP